MLKNGKVLLTIVVPAYNVEKYIAACLESLIGQTKINHKIIIVNDGSTDHTAEICEQYETKYPELITYIYQDNQGLGDARNAGIKRADTPYICFLDSDDWLNIKYVEVLSDLIAETDELPDIIFTLPWVFDSVTKRVNPWKDKERFERIFEINNGHSLVQTNAVKKPELYALEVNACRKIYRTSFLRKKNFSFPSHLKWEDVPGHFYLLHHANTCMALPEIGFFYRTNQGGQITAGGGVSRMDMLPIFNQLLEVARKNNFNDVENAYVIRLIVDFSIWSIEVTNLEYLNALLKGLHEIFKLFSTEEIRFYLNEYSTNKEQELGYITCLTGPDYLRLADYITRDDIIKENLLPTSEADPTEDENNPKRNLIKGGLQCISDHGISYTIIWIVRKYFFKGR